MKALDASVLRRINEQEGVDPFFWLLDFLPSATESVFMTNNNDSVTFEGRTYEPFPFDVGQHVTDAKGNLSDLVLDVKDVTGDIADLVRKYFGFGGQKVILRLVLKKLSSGVSTEATKLTFEVGTSAVEGDNAKFILGKIALMRHVFPVGRFWRERCRLNYKGALCGYVGTLPTCDFTLGAPNGCQAHDITIRFGGFPGIPAQ